MLIKDLFIDKSPTWSRGKFLTFFKRIENGLASAGFNLEDIEHSKVIDELKNGLSSTSPRKHYKKFIKELRSEIKKGISPLTETICASIFKAQSAKDFCNKITQSTILAGRELKQKAKKKKVFNPLINHLLSSYHCIKSAPLEVKNPVLYQIFLNGKGYFNIDFDPTIQNNTPHPSFKMDFDGKCIENLRFCTPTKESKINFLPFLSLVHITPEFIVFLKKYEKESKHHVYFNLQDRKFRLKPKTNESYRSKAIEALQKDFPETITVVTLTKNTNFYHQRMKYKKLNSARMFKAKLLQKLFDSKNSGFYLPPKLKAEDFKSKTEALVEEIHQDLFGKRAFLKRVERCDFIEIFYTYFQELVLLETNADSYNASCRDSIDRGGGANSLMYFYQKLRMGHENSQDFNRELTSLTFSPAILVKKRAIQKRRLDRLLSAMNHLLHNANKVKQRPSPVKAVELV